MTYLPELRESIVAAAERQAAGGPAEPARRRPRPTRRPFGAFALMAASVVAILVAGAVLVLARHPGSQTAAPSQAGRQHQLELAAATAIIDGVHPPHAIRLAPGSTAAQSIASGLDGPTPIGSVHLWTVWRVPGDRRSAMNFIEKHPPAGGGVYEVSSSSSETSGNEQPNTAGFRLTPVGAVQRQLAVALAPAGANTLVRVDAYTYWGNLRPASEQIPATVTRIQVHVTGALGKPSHGQPAPHRHVTLTRPADVREILSYFNSLPAAQPQTPVCRSGSGATVHIAFLQGTALRVIADLPPNCGIVSLSIDGRPQLPLAIAAETVDIHKLLHVFNLLAGVSNTSVHPARTPSRR